MDNFEPYYVYIAIDDFINIYPQLVFVRQSKEMFLIEPLTISPKFRTRDDVNRWLTPENIDTLNDNLLKLVQKWIDMDINIGNKVKLQPKIDNDTRSINITEITLNIGPTIRSNIPGEFIYKNSVITESKKRYSAVHTLQDNDNIIYIDEL